MKSTSIRYLKSVHSTYRRVLIYERTPLYKIDAHRVSCLGIYCFSATIQATETVTDSMLDCRYLGYLICSIKH